MKKLVYCVAGLLALAACNKTEPAKEALPFRISPVLTKVTSTSFETGDAIGVSIVRDAQYAYADNQKLTYNGSEFTGDLKWFTEEGSAFISAYHPYSSTAPTAFAVQADQTAGLSSSDFITGFKNDVKPSEQAVVIPFKHKLTHVVANLVNNSNGIITGFSLADVRLKAVLDAGWEPSEDESAPKGTVKARKVNDSKYDLILPPQKATMTAVVTLQDGKELSQVQDEITLESGKEYTLTVIVEPEAIHVVLSGDVQDWEEGGEIVPSSILVEKLDEGYILYHEDKYTVAKMKDGKWWMTQNMRYVPEGIEVSNDLTQVTAGVFYPVVVKADNSGAEFSRDITVIKAHGYLYQAEVALGLQVGDLTSVDAAQALEGAKGLCPKGWHVPTKADIAALVGKGVDITTDPSAPYYDGANGSIVMLNEDGFNMDAFGAVSIQDNTKTAGTLMGWATKFPDKISSGMFCGSTYASVTYNTKDDPESGVKNLQFYGFMPMTNKATEAEYTCNGTKVSYRIAAPLRCVRDSE